MTWNWVSYAAGLGSTALLWVAKEIIAPDFLDFRRQHRAAELQREAEARAHERADQPVRDRIAAALRTQLRSMRRVFIHGMFSLEEWQHWHNELKALVDSTDGARALGNAYQPFVAALHHDQGCINIQTRYLAEWKEPEDSESRRARFAVRQHDAHTAENIASSILEFVPLMRALGLAEADDFERSALQQIDLAHHMYREMPPIT